MASQMARMMERGGRRCYADHHWLFVFICVFICENLWMIFIQGLHGFARMYPQMRINGFTNGTNDGTRMTKILRWSSLITCVYLCFICDDLWMILIHGLHGFPLIISQMDGTRMTQMLRGLARIIRVYLCFYLWWFVDDSWLILNSPVSG